MASVVSARVDESTRDTPEPAENDLYISQMTFKGRNSLELSMERHDVLIVQKDATKMWWMAQNARGERGYVASCWLQEYDPEVEYCTDSEDDADEKADTDDDEDSGNGDDDDEEAETDDQGDSGLEADKEDGKEAPEDANTSSQEEPLSTPPPEVVNKEDATLDASEAVEELSVTMTSVVQEDLLPSPQSEMRTEPTTGEKGTEHTAQVPLPSPTPSNQSAKGTRKRTSTVILDPLVLSRTSTRTIKPTAKIVEMRAAAEGRLTYAEVKKARIAETSNRSYACKTSEQGRQCQLDHPKKQQQKRRFKKEQFSAGSSSPSETTLPFSLPQIKQEITHEEEISDEQFDSVAKIMEQRIRKEVEDEIRRKSASQESELMKEKRELEEKVASLQASLAEVTAGQHQQQPRGKSSGPAGKRAGN